ncbi:hypothetical protein Hypma_001987 [Hypsizygus marmoreus]|uniref:Uncharacterized protein n=1 Tax=Hypsizygus marmoreus TaxID=39966 RepID=A0A369J965_HYPMA|nr:hypothetical protein Hypma_001987 [Hypsizygus marmoreus]
MDICTYCNLLEAFVDCSVSCGGLCFSCTAGLFAFGSFASVSPHVQCFRACPNVYSPFATINTLIIFESFFLS